MNIKSLVASFFIFTLFISEVCLSDELLKRRLFVIESNTDTLIKDVEIILSNNKFQLSKKIDQIFEIYFDTPELHYYNNQGYVRYQAVQFLSKRKKKKKYHESIQYSYNASDSSYSVKHYNNVKSYEEKHSLLGLVKRKERIKFIKKIKEDGIKYPMRLKSILQVGKISYNYILSNKNKVFMTLKIHDLETNNLSNDITLSMIEINSDKEVISHFDNNDRKSIELFYQVLIDNLFKDNKSSENEYKALVELLEKNDKYFYFNFKNPEIINLLYAMAISIIGLIILSFFFIKRENYEYKK